MTGHKRRPRYAGKTPRRFEDKYKEHDPARHSETVAKVLAAVLPQSEQPVNRLPVGKFESIFNVIILHYFDTVDLLWGVWCERSLMRIPVIHNAAFIQSLLRMIQLLQIFFKAECTDLTGQG